ncbi:Glycine amidinotransferase, mitochondrial [Tolypocladium ophioglossoides CBS 100239]|uniref:Glycine amidinotransferase, mitochondrial n=1 Tax=Tolypocladium ophioglossoides (strain CBS 100239) TaxID=1163406 RepID=A0A0L0NC61_TOLOC|nr:Glycine amidinotransferase, mitochondrial [Tolypocladium ophioglossoides CBS 100239]
MRFGKTIIAHVSNVTSKKGIEYVQAMVFEGYTLEILETIQGLTTRHIDSTILPLRKAVAVQPATHWEIRPYPFAPQPRATAPPQFMCSPWLKRIFVEENNTDFANWVKEEFGMEPIMIPFAHVNSIGGSFHCATVDLVRSPQDVLRLKLLSKRAAWRGCKVQNCLGRDALVV